MKVNVLDCVHKDFSWIMTLKNVNLLVQMDLLNPLQDIVYKDVLVLQTRMGTLIRME